MLREPKKAEKAVETHKANQVRRFQIVKLEERIAPLCSFYLNPGGKLVVHCTHRGFA